MTGRLIVFEGVEGGGKTTQIARSRQWLEESGWLEFLQTKGYIQGVAQTREPGGTSLGQALRQVLLNDDGAEPLADRAELLLYAADRAQHVEGYLRPLLATGTLILCDRYTDSTVAYQGYGRQLDLSLIDQLNHIATNGLHSDLTLWFDLPVELGLARTRQRGASDRMEQADITFHQRVQQGFQVLAHQFPQRIVRIDASQPEAMVAAQVQDILHTYLSQWYAPLP